MAIEKKMTVPRSAVERIAPPSQPGTSTQTTVTSAGPPAFDHGVAQRDRVAGVGDHDLVGEPGGPERVGLWSVGTTPIVCGGARLAGRGQAQRAGLARRRR